MPQIILNESIDLVLEKIFNYRNEQGLQIFSVNQIDHYEQRKDMSQMEIPVLKKVGSLDELSGLQEYFICCDGRSIIYLKAEFEKESNNTKGNTLLYPHKQHFTKQARLGYEILENLLGFEC